MIRFRHGWLSAALLSTCVGFTSAIVGPLGELSAAEASPDAASAADTKPITSVLKEGIVALRVRFGSKQAPGQQTLQPTKWDGQVQVAGAKVVKLSLWQDDPRDKIEGNQWILSSKHASPWNREERKKGHQALPVVDAALVVELADVRPEAKLAFRTAQGDFSVELKDLVYGQRKGFLQGLVHVDFLANAATILSAPTEDDYVSAAQTAAGKLSVAYVAFTHGKAFRSRGNLPAEPKSLDFLSAPPGGDQVFLLQLDGEQWTGPLPVTPPGQDVFRTATAIDGSGRTWIFWTAKVNGQWDLFARGLQGDRWSDVLQLSNDADPDLWPTAATDITGRVWVAWQAFHGGKSRIVTLRQDGDKFGPPTVVAEGKGNAWAPSIAASADGQVAVAWDTYDKGDYDVYVRIWAADNWSKPIPVAATLAGETRPSVAYDKANRLWIAYEKSPPGWGKDWGALKKVGVPLYGSRSVEVRVWADNKLWRTASDPADSFVGPQGTPPTLARPGEAAPGGKNKPALAGGNVKLANPRLAVDKAGHVWLVVRSTANGGVSPVGTWWYDHAAYFDGKNWSSQIVVPHTDNILDNIPALVARPSGSILLIASADGRAAQAGRLPPWLLQELKQSGERLFPRPTSQAAPWPDPVNNELVAAELGPVPGPQLGRPDLEPAEAVVATPTASTLAESEQLARARAARVEIGGKSLRLWRGEFHRHTELSPDGGGDGTLIDLWRYALDAGGLDWIGNGDHDNGNGREYSWWYVQKTTDLFTLDGVFTPVFSYERSVNYPDGHRNVVFAKRGIRTLPRLANGMGKALDGLPANAPRPHSPDTQLLYRYLEKFDGICASHTSGTDMGTDWRDNNPQVEPVVEIYQGCRQNYEMPGAPRSNTAADSIGGWRPLGFVSLALKKGYRFGFQSSSDHISTHISFCSVWVEKPTREGIVEALKARHVYGATDNIVAAVRSGEHFMGDEFTTASAPKLSVHLTGTGPFAKVHVIKDGNYVHSTRPNKQKVDFEWVDLDAKPGTTSYYYVRGEQADGELVWVSPLWITYKP